MTTPSLNPTSPAKPSEENKEEENTTGSSNEGAGGEDKNTSTEVSAAKLEVKAKDAPRPCDWLIVPLKGENIEATHISTREVFTGTVAEFNKMLRG